MGMNSQLEEEQQCLCVLGVPACPSCLLLCSTTGVVSSMVTMFHAGSRVNSAA